MHRLTMAVNQGIDAKVFSQRGPPTHPLWARTSVFANEYKYSSECPISGAWRQQPKIADGVPVSIWDVLYQSGNEGLE
jgi:hypothetical protein